MSMSISGNVMMLLKGVPIAMANALRRTVLSKIPVWAIDNVKISTNTGPLHCEYVSHRMSLIPVEQPFARGLGDLGDFGGLGDLGDLGDFGGLGEDDNYGPNAATLAAAPKVEYSPYGDGDLSEAMYQDLTFQISVKTTRDEMVEITTKNITATPAWFDCTKIFKDEYLITKLKGKDGAFECKFEIRQGTAGQHAKWQAVNTIAYRYHCADTDDRDDVSKIQYDAISLAQEQKSDRQGEPQGFVFYIEPASLPVSLVLQKAFDIIGDTVNAFKTFLFDPEKVSAEKSWQHDSGMLEIEYESNETHTLGNLLATYGLLQHPDAFIGYRIIHPMTKKFILRFKLQEEDFEQHKLALNTICDTIVQVTQGLKQQIK
jgi:DNA-directed RNA polymerase subunit L